MEPSVLNRLQPQLYRLAGGVCNDCENKWLGRRKICSACRSNSVASTCFSCSGTLLTWTRIERLPAAIQSMPPHYQGLVKVNDGPLVLCMLTDCYDREPKIGDTGSLVTRRISVESESSFIVYGYKFCISHHSHPLANEV